MSCNVGRRCGSDPALLWLWCSSYSSDLTPSLGTSICLRCSPKKTKKKSPKSSPYSSGREWGSASSRGEYQRIYGHILNHSALSIPYPYIFWGKQNRRNPPSLKANCVSVSLFDFYLHILITQWLQRRKHFPIPELLPKEMVVCIAEKSLPFQGIYKD